MPCPPTVNETLSDITGVTTAGLCQPQAADISKTRLKTQNL